MGSIGSVILEAGPGRVIMGGGRGRERGEEEMGRMKMGDKERVMEKEEGREEDR